MPRGTDIAREATGAPWRSPARRAWTPLGRALSATGDRWTLTIVLALAPGKTRLTHLRARLPGISTGVLERHVQQMVTLGLLTRTRFREMPPRVELDLTDSGRELLPVAGTLARWGMRNLWSAPTARELVDVGALLRLLPVLLAGQALPGGSLEAIVLDAEPQVRCRYRIGDGSMRLEWCAPERAGAGPPPDEAAGEHPLVDTEHRGASRPAETPTATIEGDAHAWIAALGPSRELGGLSVTGEASFARRLLEALPGKAGAGLPQ